MHHELLALERQAMREKIETLQNDFTTIHSDFAKCAKDHLSPCVFCENHEICNGCPGNCKFTWHKHN